MLAIRATDAWRTAHPGATIGLLELAGLENTRASAGLDRRKRETEARLMNGAARAIHPGDMVMRDADGICCSIIHGQDDRSPVSVRTSRVLYVAYAPPGVPAASVAEHLRAVEENVRSCGAAVQVEQLRLLTAGGA